MDKTNLNAIARRLQAERDTRALELARLDQELAGVKASLAVMKAADICASISPSAARRMDSAGPPNPLAVASVPRKPGARVPMSELANQSGVRTRAPSDDPAVAAFLSGLVKVDFSPEVPVMSPRMLVKRAAETRTIRRGDATDAHNPGIRTICRAFLRGELPSYCSMLRTVASLPVGQRQRLTRALNDAADIAVLHIYPWLCEGQELPLTVDEKEAINSYCRNLAIRSRAAATLKVQVIEAFAPVEPSLLPQSIPHWNGVPATTLAAA